MGLFDYIPYEIVSSLEESVSSQSGYRSEEKENKVQYDHLDGVGSNCGCAEVWEVLSNEREDLSPEDLE